MAIDKNILEHLKYSACSCEIDYREELGIFNGICPAHSNSVLMVDGKPVAAFIKEVKEKAKKLAHKPANIV